MCSTLHGCISHFNPMFHLLCCVGQYFWQTGLASVSVRISDFLFNLFEQKIKISGSKTTAGSYMGVNEVPLTTQYSAGNVAAVRQQRHPAASMLLGASPSVCQPMCRIGIAAEQIVIKPSHQIGGNLTMESPHNEIKSLKFQYNLVAIPGKPGLITYPGDKRQNYLFK